MSVITTRGELGAVVAVGSATAAGFSWADAATYTLTLALERTDVDAFQLTATVHAGNDTDAAALASATVTTTSSATLPSALAGAFDAIAIGYRNRDGASVSYVRVAQVTVEHTTTTAVEDAYASFLALHGLDPATTGAPASDPDADGVANSLEFLLGGNPTTTDPAILPVVAEVTSGGATTGWTFGYARSVAALDQFTDTIETSTDLATWTAAVAGVDGVTIDVTPQGEDVEWVEATFPAAAGLPRWFARLRVDEVTAP